MACKRHRNNEKSGWVAVIVVVENPGPDGGQWVIWWLIGLRLAQGFQPPQLQPPTLTSHRFYASYKPFKTKLFTERISTILYKQSDIFNNRIISMNSIWIIIQEKSWQHRSLLLARTAIHPSLLGRTTCAPPHKPQADRVNVRLDQPRL